MAVPHNMSPVLGSSKDLKTSILVSIERVKVLLEKDTEGMKAAGYAKMLAHEILDHEARFKSYMFNRCTIQEANKCESLEDEFLANLRVGGTDAFSRSSRKQLMEKLKPEDLETICSNISDKDLQVRAMRWTARGLYVKHAIKKVIFDETTYNNRLLF